MCQVDRSESRVSGKLEAARTKAAHVFRSPVQRNAASALSARSWPRVARRGVGLLEVLISMFIILFGLLGVAALLEVGRSDLASATRHDRAIACGVSALAEARVRRLHNPNSWLAWYDNNNPYPNWNQNNPCTAFTAGWFPPPRVVRDNSGTITEEYEQYLQHYQAYAIDPLYIDRFLGENPGATAADVALNTARFPYGAGAPIWMGRCSLNVPLLASSPARLALFDRMFTWSDDRIFDVPKDPQARPTRVFDSLGVGQFEGNYSWLLTVCPVPTEANEPVSNKRYYEVSAVVFYQRDFSPPSAPSDPAKPSERWLIVDLVGGGFGGGDVVLRAPPAGNAEWLKIREGDWILLGGKQLVSAPPPVYRNIFKWYRVIMADEIQNDLNGPYCRATLNGQNWSPSWRADTNGDGSINAMDFSVGIVCNGVVNVFTQLMELEP